MSQAGRAMEEGLGSERGKGWLAKVASGSPASSNPDGDLSGDGWWRAWDFGADRVRGRMVEGGLGFGEEKGEDKGPRRPPFELSAANDPNDNPRRLWRVARMGDVWEEREDLVRGGDGRGSKKGGGRESNEEKIVNKIL